MVQREQVMDIVDEKNIVEAARKVKKLLQSSTVIKSGDETKIKKVVNLGLTPGEPYSPEL